MHVITLHSCDKSVVLFLLLLPRIGSFQGIGIANTSTKINDLKHNKISQKRTVMRRLITFTRSAISLAIG